MSSRTWQSCYMSYNVVCMSSRRKGSSPDVNYFTHANSPLNGLFIHQKYFTLIFFIFINQTRGINRVPGTVPRTLQILIHSVLSQPKVGSIVIPP